MKNLANCKPSEFLKQVNRIRKSAKHWLKVTDVMEIRKRMPKGMPELSADLSQDETDAVIAKREEMMAAQIGENLDAILDALLEEHPDETLELLALCCFVEPNDIDSYTVSQLLESVNELVQDKAVRDFFMSLMSLTN